MTIEENEDWQGFLDTLMNPREWDAILDRNREMTRSRRGGLTPDFNLPEPDPEKEGRLRLPEPDKEGRPGYRVHRRSEEEPDAEAIAPTCCRCGELVVLNSPLVHIRSVVKDCAKCARPIHKACARNVLGECRTRTLCRNCGDIMQWHEVRGGS